MAFQWPGVVMSVGRTYRVATNVLSRGDMVGCFLGVGGLCLVSLRFGLAGGYRDIAGGILSLSGDFR